RSVFLCSSVTEDKVRAMGSLWLTAWVYTGGTSTPEASELTFAISFWSMQAANAWRAHCCSKTPESEKISESVRSPTTSSISKSSDMVSLSNHLGLDTAASATNKLSCCVTSATSASIGHTTR